MASTEMAASTEAAASAGVCVSEHPTRGRVLLATKDFRTFSPSTRVSFSLSLSLCARRLSLLAVCDTESRGSEQVQGS